MTATYPPHKERIRIMKEITRYTLPAYWASYLINNDATGLEEGEQETIDTFLVREGIAFVHDCGEPSFAHCNDATSLGGDVCEYIVTMRG